MGDTGIGSGRIPLSLQERLHPTVEKVAWATLDEHLGGITTATVKNE